MPKAVTTEETVRRDLETLPDGFVVLRRSNFGEQLKLRTLIAQFEQGEGGTTTAIDYNAIVQYQLMQFVVEHNLEDESGKTMDFAKKDNVQRLDPTVGAEVERLIDAYNSQGKVPEKKKAPLDSKSSKP